MQVMKQPKQGLELQISNGVLRMERRVKEGRHTGERRKKSVAKW